MWFWLWLTVSSTELLKNLRRISFSKHFCVVDQSLPHRLGSSQNHSFLRSKVNSEDRTIFLGKLKMAILVTRRKENQSWQTKSRHPVRPGSHLYKRVEGSFQVKLQQVPQQRKRSGSWRLLGVCLGVGGPCGGPVDQQQEQQGCQQWDGAERGLKEKVKKCHGLGFGPPALTAVTRRDWESITVHLRWTTCSVLGVHTSRSTHNLHTIYVNAFTLFITGTWHG